MNKLDVLKKLALAGAAVVTAAFSQEEAQAAGLETIARKLGVGLEEAARIKKLAQQKIPQDVFEENIKAIKNVSDYKKNPSAYKKLGSGMDYRALETPSGGVLKEPKEFTPNDELLSIAPPIVEHVGLGPKTKSIHVGDKTYMLQDKVLPMENINMSALWDDPIMKELSQQESQLLKRREASVDQIGNYEGYFKEKKALQKKMLDRQHELLKAKGLDVQELNNYYQNLTPKEKQFIYERAGITPDEVNAFPQGAFEGRVNMEAEKKLSPYLKPRDLHQGNIGLSKEGKPTIFDTSRFDNLKVESLTQEMKQKIIDSNISLPAKKEALKQLLQAEDYKKAAAIAPLMGMNGQEESEPSMLDRVKDVGQGLVSKGIDTYEGLSPETKTNISAAMNVLSQPGAALRGATFAAQKGTPILEGTRKAWDDPEAAPTGEQIAEAANLSDDQVLAKTALATAADFADPIDWTALGAISKASKLKALGKLK